MWTLTAKPGAPAVFVRCGPGAETVQTGPGRVVVLTDDQCAHVKASLAAERLTDLFRLEKQVKRDGRKDPTPKAPAKPRKRRSK